MMNIDDEEAKDAMPSTPPMTGHQPPPPPSPPPPPPPVSRYKWWLRVAVFTIFLLSGQAISTLLLRLYFDKGGNSKWMSALVQTGGFPILLLPLLIIFFFPTQKRARAPQNNPSPSTSSITALLYIFIGILLATNCVFYSFGIANLPVSTFSLICTSQLAFTAFFSYVLNTQKFTPLIINSLVLLTISSTLLVFQNNDDTQGGSSSSSKISKNKYAIGFVCTVVGAAAGGLLLSVSQFALNKVLKSTTFRVVLNLAIYPCFVATVLIMIGLFASGEWKTIKGEMEGYELGTTSYVITLVGIAITLQANIVGLIGLISEVSSLFSNVITGLGVPIVPIFAVVFFHDKMSGVKVIAMLLAIWGIASYIYQEYLDESKSKIETNVNEIPLAERA